jgi:hypothetical protein
MSAMRAIRGKQNSVIYLHVNGALRARIRNVRRNDELYRAGPCAGVAHKARQYIIKIEIGGIPGVIAPIASKKPLDSHV